MGILLRVKFFRLNAFFYCYTLPRSDMGVPQFPYRAHYIFPFQKKVKLRLTMTSRRKNALSKTVETGLTLVLN